MGRTIARAALALLLAGASTVSASDVPTVLARKDFAAETSARMMAVLAAASGQRALAECLHDRYFGSPLLLRRTLWKAWNDPSADFAQALLAAATAACLSNPTDVTGSERQTWLRTGNESVLLEPGTLTAEPAAAMIAAYQSMRGDHAAAQCAQDQGKRSEANRLVSEAANQTPRVPVTLSAYDAYRTLCGLNATGPAASEIKLPAMPDVATVARERLSIVQDFAICQAGGTANQDGCLDQAYRMRSKRLFNQLLSGGSLD